MAKIKPLRRSRIFSSLSDRELALFSRIVSEEEFIRGTVLVAENMRSDRFFLIEKGKVAVSSAAVAGSGELVLRDGDTFGEWSLVAPAHLTSVAAKITEEAQVLVISRDDFDRFAEQEPAIALKVMRGLVERAWPSLLDIAKLVKESA